MPDPDGQTALLSFAAKLYYLDGLGQTEIADMIGASRSTVSRLLARARESGIVSITVNDYCPRNEAMEAELKRRYALRHAIVVRTLPDQPVSGVRQTIGYTAAPELPDMIQPNSVVGMAGGRTLYELVRFMQPARPINGIVVAQLMSNIGSLVGEIDAIELGRVMAHKFGADFYSVSAPVFAADSQTRDVFINHEQVRVVWRLFDIMDVAFVGIGTLANSAFVERRVLSADELSRLQSQGVVGEICGRFFDVFGQECDTEYRNRVISIEFDDLRRIPEVIGVTNGADRAVAVGAALRGGLLKSLIIDENGAGAVLSQSGLAAS